MSCREHADAIVDLARGMSLEAGKLREVREHLSRCEACRVRLAHEESLTAGLEALAKSVADASPSPGLESRLLDAFHAQHAPVAARPVAEAPRADATSRVSTSHAGWMGLAAAAVLGGIAALGWWLATPAHVVQETVATAPPAPAAPVPPPPRIAPVISAPVSDPASPSRPPRKGRPDGGILRPSGFVVLPTAVGLPQFESGVITRVEIPLTSLPTYGIQIAPDAAQSSVPAEILVGQDGLARAIRLVRSSVTSTNIRSVQ